MKTQFLKAFALFTLIFGLSFSAYSADTPPVYGSQLMTEQERNEHRKRMRNAESELEREKIRKEHHKRMKIRAEKRGIELPDTPPIRGGMGKKQQKGPGMNPGMNPGKGKGMGPGAGMGKGNR